jgi:exonuclease III
MAHWVQCLQDYRIGTSVIKLNAEPINVLIVQLYMPTSDYEDEEVEELYDRIENILEEDGKGDTNTIIMGD